MILSVFERAVLMNVLPKEGNFTNLKALRVLKENLSLSEDENKIYQPQIIEGKFFWKTQDDEGNPIPQNKEIEIGEIVTELIKKTLKNLNSQNKLKEEHISLYEKFIED